MSVFVPYGEQSSIQVESVSGDKVYDVVVPQVHLGGVIGKGGETIRAIQATYRVHIHVHERESFGAETRRLTISANSLADCHAAEAAIRDVIASKERQSRAREDSQRDRTQQALRWRRRVENTLLGFIKSLVGYTVSVECRNETTWTGLLQSVNDDMDVILDGAVKSHPLYDNELVEHAYIKGRLIRYVHIPDEVNVERHMWTLRQTELENHNRYQRHRFVAK